MKTITFFTIIIAVALAGCLQAADGPALLTIPLAESRGVMHTEFSPDSKTILTAFNNNTACILDAETGEKLKTFKRMRFAFFSSNGKHIVAVGDEPVVQIWDIESGTLLKNPHGRLFGGVPISISPNGKFFVMNAEAGEKVVDPSIWDADLGKELYKIPLPSSDELHFAFSEEGTKLVTISAHRTFRIWNTESGKLLHEWEKDPIVQRIIWSPDGTKLIMSDGNAARIWEAASGKELQKLEGHNGFLYSIAFSPDGKKCATASADETARIWDAETGKELHKLQGDPHDRYKNPPGPMQIIRNDNLEGQSLVQFEQAVFSPDGKMLLTTGKSPLDKTARIWDVESGKELYVLPTGTDSLVINAAFSPNGKKIVTFAGGLSIRVWDLERIQAQADQPPVLDF